LCFEYPDESRFHILFSASKYSFKKVLQRWLKANAEALHKVIGFYEVRCSGAGLLCFEVVSAKRKDYLLIL